MNMVEFVPVQFFYKIHFPVRNLWWCEFDVKVLIHVRCDKECPESRELIVDISGFEFVWICFERFLNLIEKCCFAPTFNEYSFTDGYFLLIIIITLKHIGALLPQAWCAVAVFGFGATVNEALTEFIPPRTTQCPRYPGTDKHSQGIPVNRVYDLLSYIRDLFYLPYGHNPLDSFSLCTFNPIDSPGARISSPSPHPASASPHTRPCRR